MNARTERCWYCRERVAVIWCDHMLGSALAPDQCEWDPQRGEPRVEGAGCQNTATWIVGADGYARVCDACAAAPKLRRFRSRKRIEQPVEIVETCNAAACGACARGTGWTRIGHICARPASLSQTIDLCHAHRGLGLGSAAWIGAPAIAVLRSDVRAACVRAHAAFSTCSNDQTSGGSSS